MSFGISKRTVLRFNKIGSPSDKRIKLFPYESIPQKYQQKIKDKVGNINVATTISEIDILLQDNPDDRALIRQSNAPIKKQSDLTLCCQYLHLIAQSNDKGISTKILALIKAKNLPLPKSKRSLVRKAKEYKEIGAQAVISKKYGNNNAQKITATIADYIMGYYQIPNRYISIPELTMWYHNTKQDAWPELEERTILNFLSKPENERIWSLQKFGKDSKAYTKFAHHLRLQKATQSDHLWIVGSTKLDVYFQVKGKNMATFMKMNVIVDGASEKILAIRITPTDNSKDQIEVLKSAVDNTGTRPWQYLYDKQSSHTSPVLQAIYDKVIRPGGTHYHSRPHNPKAKQIEHIFNRIQKQIVNKFWFSSGQSPMSNDQQVKENNDWLSENRHDLPFAKDIYALGPKIKKAWNDSYYPKTKETRSERYVRLKDNPYTLDELDIVNIFYEQTKRPITYRNGGICPEINKDKYIYEVYLGGAVDIEFRRIYMGEKFIIKYDPTDMTRVYLFQQYKDDLVFVAIADDKNLHTQVFADQTNPDAHWKDFRTRDIELKNDRKRVKEIADNSGFTEENYKESEVNIAIHRHAVGKATKKEQELIDEHSLVRKLINR